ncbi:hypothetical protein [Mesorhizobium sp. M1378]|uniref:hypothetical protein n=1 Tax=Mesorhizobium sp. M1378 TaxID=2957092 RepID=UPI00333BB48D
MKASNTSRRTFLKSAPTMGAFCGSIAAHFAPTAEAVAANHGPEAKIRGDVPIFHDTYIGMSKVSVPNRIGVLQVSGYAAVGDGGAAIYKKVIAEPSHQGKFRSGDGAWWEIAERVVAPEMFGAVGDGSASDNQALFAMANFGRFHRQLRVVGLPGRIYSHTNPYFLANIPYLDVDLNGAKLRNIAGGKRDSDYLTNYVGLAFPTVFETHGHQKFGGQPTPFNFGETINTVFAGATEIEISIGITDLTRGMRVLIYGFECLGAPNAMPPCPKHFEWNEVESVDGRTVKLVKPLEYDYDSGWPDFGTSNVYGKPRVLSVDRADFVMGRSVRIRNGEIDANPNWSADGATRDRNGLLQIAGFDFARVENVNIAGGCYVSTGRVAEFNSVRIAGTLESDKVVSQISYRNVTGRRHISGNGTRSIIMQDCEFWQSMNINPIERLVIYGGQFRGSDETKSSALVGQGGGTRYIALAGQPRFQVDSSHRKNLFSYQNRNITIAVINSNTISITREAYDKSQIYRACFDVGTFLIAADGSPAFRITRLPYENGSNIHIDGVQQQLLSTGDVLYACYQDEVDVESVRYGGRFGHQIKTYSLANFAEPFPVKVRDAQRDVGRWSVSHIDMTVDGSLASFKPGRRVSLNRLSVHVVKAYSGRTESALLRLEQSAGRISLALINLRITGRRVMDATGVYGSAVGDTLIGLGTPLLDSLDMQTTELLAAANDGEMPLWYATLEGIQI